MVHLDFSLLLHITLLSTILVRIRPPVSVVTKFSSGNFHFDAGEFDSKSNPKQAGDNVYVDFYFTLEEILEPRNISAEWKKQVHNMLPMELIFSLSSKGVLPSLSGSRWRAQP